MLPQKSLVNTYLLSSIAAIFGTVFLAVFLIFLNTRKNELAHEFERQKEIQEDLRESEATLKSAFRAAPVGIGMMADRLLLQANSRRC